MKKVKKLLIAMCMCLAVFLCTPKGMPDSFGSITAEAASNVKLNKKKATLYVGETLKLKVKGTKSKVKWSSNKKSVATVTSKGKVKAKKKGTATITAKVDGKKYKCKVTVKSGISANKTSLQIDDTSAENVEITLKNGGVDYSIADTNIVSCKWGKWSGNNIPLTIYGRKAGTTTITVRNTFTNEKINIKVTVIHKTIPVSNVTLSKSLLNMEVGDTEVLSATIYPSNADDNNISWTSSDTSVATVNNGVISAIAPGSTIVTATVGSKSTSCTVVVNPSYGSLSGTVTYFYNNYRGNVADTNADVILIPRDGTALNMPTLSSYIYWSGNLIGNANYKVYGTRVDGYGKFVLQNIPAGEYVMIIVSKKTTDGRAFADLEAYQKNIAILLSGGVNETNAQYFGKYVGYKKYTYKLITIQKDFDTVISHDFGITFV